MPDNDSNKRSSNEAGTLNIYRKSTPSSPASGAPESPDNSGSQITPSPVQDDLKITISNAMKLSNWERIKQFPFSPCVLTSVSTGFLAASALSGVMLVKRRPFSSCANTFVLTSTLVSGTAFGICQVRLRDKKLKVIELQQEIRRKHEDQVLKERLEARLRLREEERSKKREDWLSGLAPNMASAPSPDSKSDKKE